MADPLTQQFINALHHAEQTKEIGPLVSLFAADAEVQSPVRSAAEYGTDGARRFWEDYIGLFADVRSDFTSIRDFGDFTALQWTAAGTLSTGQPIRYSGVSLLEHHAGRVTRFTTYYDSAPFLPAGSKHTAAPSA
jgi:ketosteroid isomerase-like protein